LNIFERALLPAGAAALIFPGFRTDLTGTVIYIHTKKWPEKGSFRDRPPERRYLYEHI